jgi:hypothetical protein
MRVESVKIEDLGDSQCSTETGRGSGEDGVDVTFVGADEQPALHVPDCCEGLSGWLCRTVELACS